MLEELENELADLTASMQAMRSADKVRTPEYAKMREGHALLTSLIDNRGGSPEQKIEFVNRMHEISNR